MRRDRIRNTFALGLVGLLLVGAGVAMTGARLEPADLTFHNATEPESLDPAKVTGVPGGRVLRALFAGLTVQAPDSTESLPDIAESWTISPDGRIYTFRIRKNARWSDGSPLTAEDFVYSWRRLFAPETAAKYAYLCWSVKSSEEYTKGKAKAEDVGVSAPDPHTFAVELKEPCGYFIYLTAFYPTFPVHRATVERYPDDWFKPDRFVGNGAFKLERRLIRERMRVVKNEHYWDARNVDLETVDILPIEDQVTALNLYLTGACDWITDVPSHVVPELLKRDDFNPAPRLGVYFYRINQNNEDPDKRRFFGDRRVRRALYLAVDRKAICERVTRAGDVPARSLVPPGMAGYRYPMLPDYDPKAAKALLDEALKDLGFDEAPPFTILYNTLESHKSIAEVVQAGWRKHLGLAVKIENMEWQSYLKTESSFKYDITRAGWIGDYPDPNTFLDLWQTGNGNNRTGWSNPEFDRRIRLAASTADLEARLEILAKAEEVALHDQVVIPIYYYVTKNCVRPWVKGWQPNIQDRHNLKFVSIDRARRRDVLGY